MIQIDYNNTIPEIKRAYSLHRRKYALRKMIFISTLCIITLVFGVDFIRRSLINPQGGLSDYTGYIVVALGAAMLISLWSRPFMMQKKLINTIEQLNDEKYTARFFDDRIEIETQIVPADEATETIAVTRDGVNTVENPEAVKEAEESIATAETTVIGLKTEQLFSIEDNDIFCLFVNKALIYIFPKRCLSGEQVVELQKYFSDKSI